MLAPSDMTVLCIEAAFSTRITFVKTQKYSNSHNDLRLNNSTNSERHSFKKKRKEKPTKRDSSGVNSNDLSDFLL